MIFTRSRSFNDVGTIPYKYHLNSNKGKDVLFRGDYYELLESINKEFQDKLSSRIFIFRKNKLF